jgi:hypothetical protein
VTVRELRIHGVGGSPGEKLLGLSSPDEAVVVGEGLGTVFLARRRDPDVEGFDWGGLTSGSVWQPFWVLLLPFTLVNVAGWGHPAFDSIGQRRLGLLRWMVHLAAALLTASWVVWTAIIAVDYVGYQWLIGLHGWPWWGGVGIGTFLTLAVARALWKVADSSTSRCEEVPVDPALVEGLSRPVGWGRTEDLSSIWFFSHEKSMEKRLRWHVWVIVGTVAVVLLKAIISWTDGTLMLGEIFVVVGALQVGAIGALAAVSWSSAGQYAGQPCVRALPAAAVALAVALTNGFFAGAALLTARAIGEDVVEWGPELALIDGFVVVLVLWVVLAVGWVWSYRRRGDASDLPPRDPRPARELGGVDAAWGKHIAGARGLALAGHGSPRLLAWLSATFLLVGVGTTAARLDLDRDRPPWQWLRSPSEPTLLMDAAVWLMPLLVLSVMGLVWRSVRQRSLRQGVGILWDVLTFWPRRYHPLAVRPYTERAVPEFQARINYLLGEHDGLLVSAHSQGTVIAFAALAPLITLDEATQNDDTKEQRLERVALLTYGSPITTLYGQAFPAYFGQAPVDRLHAALESGPGGWRNLWRRTDPIGGPVIGAGDPTVDEEAADPATVLPSTADLTDPEPLRRPWVELAGHSYFYRERRYKDAVETLRRALNRHSSLHRAE